MSDPGVGSEKVSLRECAKLIGGDNSATTEAAQPQSLDAMTSV